MNHLIKFRVWDKKNKLMIDPFHVDRIDLDQQAVSLWHESKGDYGIAFEDAVIMQFTGEHDSDGKEIYEKDIVRHDFMFYAGNGIVDEDFNIEIVEEITKSIFDKASIGAYVLGNVFENERLLS